MKSGVFISLAVFAISCNHHTKKTEKLAVPEAHIQSILDVDPRLRQADSIVVVFYKDPHGSDSIRYTRFYTQTTSESTEDLGILNMQLTAKPSREESYRKCRGEGKIWVYANSKIFQTIYFSTQKKGCQHVYIIKDGFYYYTPPSSSFVPWLEKMKGISKEPV